jgi:N-acetylglucosamine malate deacetylase 1
MNTILVVFAHPDDEVIGCAGTIARHIKNGDKVYFLCMTNGVDSRADVTNENVRVRGASLRNSANILGVSSVCHLDFPDNQMDITPLLDIVKSIELTLSEINPNIVYTHHVGDLNIDHQITHRAVMTACRPVPKSAIKEIYAFEVLSSTEWQTPGLNSFNPNVFINISDYIKIKKKVLKIYGGEMSQTPHARSVDNILRLNALRGNSVGYDYAESYMALRIIKS